jgi:serine/threonine-protein kinase
MSVTGTPLAAQPAELPETLFGYDVIDYLGEGAGSVLYAVDEPATRQLRAMKFVTLKTDHDDRYLEQLQNEYEVGRRTSHPSLRRCYELKLHHSWLHKVTEAALLMELVDGTPLDMTQDAEPHRLIDLFARTAQGLDHLHHVGFVHCDIKPNNLLVTAGLIKVIDFGQACPIGTRKKRIQGTAEYISPEQYHCEPVTPRTDVFNLGATMYWWLCRCHIPTKLTSLKADRSFLTGDDTPAPHQLNPAVPATLSNLVMQCIRENPSKRPESMAEIVARLEAVRYGLTPHHVAMPHTTVANSPAAYA